MNLINVIYDNRIQAHNILFEITISDYFNLSKSIIEKNELQRRRVKSASTVYSLLKKDLIKGCIVPPIVLALSEEYDGLIDNKESAKLISHILHNQDNLIILDGLQRTYTIRDLFKELDSAQNSSELERLKSQKLRMEVYLGINKIGILYRMLTLNTGQTPMSMRHQIEILYSDYLNQDFEGVSLILESDDRPIKNSKEYKFQEIVEGFNSYLDRNYLPMDKNTVLDNIESLEKLSSENNNSNLFIEYLKAFDGLIHTLTNKEPSWVFKEENLSQPLTGSPFGTTVEKLFKKTQLMTGFGSAIGKLIDSKSIERISDIPPLYNKMDLGDVETTFNNYLLKLDYIRKEAKKIGNDQRMFFHHLFRELFDKNGESFCDFNKSIDEAFLTYKRKTE